MLAFALRFALLYSLLLLLSPALDPAAAGYLQSAGQLLSGITGSRLEIDSEPLPTAPYPAGLRLIIANRDLLHPDGTGPIRNLDLDAHGLLLQPLALLLALILATPFPRPRRLHLLFWCLFWQHLLLALTLALCIGNQWTELTPAALAPPWKPALLHLQQILQVQIPLALPFLIWILVAFGGGDAERINVPSCKRRADAMA